MSENQMFSYARSSRPEVFCQKDDLRNFRDQSLFLNKLADLRSAFLLKKRQWYRPATLLKKKLWRRCFTVNFTKFIITPFFMEHIRWLLL